MSEKLASALVFVAVVIAFQFGLLVGIRALGVAELGCGLYWLKRGTVSYGWRGMPSSGQLTGLAAQAAGASACALGLLFLLAPEFVQPLFCGRHGCT